MDEDWTEKTLLEHKCRVGAREKPVVALLGFPRPAGNRSEWACSFQLIGLKKQIQVAHGVDGLQALTNAATAIRNRLDRLKGVVSDTEPYELVFPKVIPGSYGLQFHRHLCGILKGEIEKKEKQLSRKRRARKKRR